jgi:hypothetical protein
MGKLLSTGSSGCAQAVSKLFAAALCSFLIGGAGAYAAEPDWSPYDRLLERHVARGHRHGIEFNRVDYGALAGDPDFAAVLASVASHSLERLDGRDERLAFYINAYNLLALKLVVDNWPLGSIKDIGNFFRPVWKRPAGTLGGREVSLGEIEHEILRKMDEPRMHFAIVCASLSCPDLRTEAYRAVRLEEQLEDQCRSFLNNATKGARVSARRVQVSRIFDWFEEDFRLTGGIVDFVRRYRTLPDRVPVRASMEYDWSLNGR